MDDRREARERRLQRGELGSAPHEAPRVSGLLAPREPVRAFVGIPVEERVAQPRQIERRARCAIEHRRRGARLLVAEDVLGRAAERGLPGERLVEHHANGVPVAPWRRGAPRQHLRGDVGRRTGDDGGARIVRRIHEAEVEEHHAPVAPDEDVRRLDVTVHEAGAVQAPEGLGQPLQRAAQARDIGAPCIEPGRLEALHGEVPAVAVAVQVVEVHEARVGEAGELAELALEAEQRLGARAPQQLQGDPRAARSIERLVDHAEAPLAEEGAQLVAPVIDVARVEGAGWRAPDLAEERVQLVVAHEPPPRSPCAVARTRSFSLTFWKRLRRRALAFAASPLSPRMTAISSHERSRSTRSTKSARSSSSSAARSAAKASLVSVRSHGAVRARTLAATSTSPSGCRRLGRAAARPRSRRSAWRARV